MQSVTSDELDLALEVWQCTAPPSKIDHQYWPYGSEPAHHGLNTNGSIIDACVARCSLCGVAETPPFVQRGPTHSDLFSASIIPSPASRLQHRPGEPPSCPGAQPSQPSCGRPLIRWQLFVLCVRVLTVLPPCFNGGSGRRPTRSSRPDPVHQGPAKRRHGPVPSVLDRTETRVTPCACPILRCTARLQLCTICIQYAQMQDARDAYDRLGDWQTRGGV